MFFYPYATISSKVSVKFLPVNKIRDPTYVVKEQFENFIKKWKNYNRVYTDGSKNSHNVGF